MASQGAPDYDKDGDMDDGGASSAFSAPSALSAPSVVFAGLFTSQFTLLDTIIVVNTCSYIKSRSN